jgi:YegS/Rv2252/BmrU family lipid kinase
MKRAAVVANPTKYDDKEKFRDLVCTAMSEHGWDEPLWLETTVDDPGTGQARAALAAGVDLVLASGGDGTVTACAAAIAGSGIPLGLIPSGTGNLLARNLGLPLELDQALVVALAGADRPLDVGRANGKAFIVMAGLGFDAKMLEGASEPLKRRMGRAAYVFSALHHLHDRPMRVTLRADGRPQLRRRASAVIIGNVGSLQAGFPLLPDAEPGDGLLNAVVLTARGWKAWLALAAHLLLRRQATSRVARIAFRELRIDVDRPQHWQLDGDVMGSTRQLLITVQDGKLLIRVPAATA